MKCGPCTCPECCSPNDERFVAQTSPFSQYPLHFIVHRHRIRVLRSLQNAKEHCRKEGTNLYVVQAHDEATRASDEKKMLPHVRADLLKRVNPEQNAGIPGFLPLYVGMRLTLLSNDCVRFSLVKGCTCVVQQIVLAEGESVPEKQ